VETVANVVYGDDPAVDTVPKPGEESPVTAPPLQQVLSVDLSEPVTELTAWVRTSSADTSKAAAAPNASSARRRLLEQLSAAASNKKPADKEKEKKGGSKKPHPKNDGRGATFKAAEGADADLLAGIVGVRVVTQGPPDTSARVFQWGEVYATAEEEASHGVRRLAADVASGKLAGVSFFKGISINKGRGGVFLLMVGGC